MRGGAALTVIADVVSTAAGRGVTPAGLAWPGAPPDLDDAVAFVEAVLAGCP